MSDLQQRIDNLAETLGADTVTVEQALVGCAQRLAKWFDGEDKAAEALTPEIAEAALIDYSESYKRMCIRVHQNPTKFAAAVLTQL